MESDFSLFRTSLNSSMYNNKYNNNIGIIGTNIQFKKQQDIIVLKYPQNNNSTHPYGYINLSQPNNFNSTDLFQRRINSKLVLLEETKDNNYSKPNSILKKEKLINQQSKNKKISFKNHNLVMIIACKEYYVDNNIKNDVWWSSKELEFIRNMFTIEVAKMQRNHPGMSVTQCIKEICKRS